VRARAEIPMRNRRRLVKAYSLAMKEALQAGESPGASALSSAGRTHRGSEENAADHFLLHS
jgi:hypothetical protein